ncbi:hypothetical protein ACFQ07_21180, partial [Actinomadura adrarensis]
MTEDFAEYGAAILDSFQNLFEHHEQPDHRTDDATAESLLGDLLTDLLHYANHRGLDFHQILRAAQHDFLQELPQPPELTLGTPVRLTGTAAQHAVHLGQPVYGAITGLVVPHQGPTEYYIRRLGDSASRQFTAQDLEPAPPFPAVPTRKGIIDHPLRAEDLLVDAAVRDATSDTTSWPGESAFDLPEHRALIRALASWNGLDDHATRQLLLNQVEHRINAGSSTPRPTITTVGAEPHDAAQLASQAFPPPLEQRHRRPAPT